MENNNGKILITQSGYEEIKKQYDNLVNVKRPAAVVRVSDTRSLGDLTQDTENIQAKQELSFVDGKISELEDVLSKLKVIKDEEIDRKQVNFGCRVTVESGNGNTVYHLVGEWEANPMEMRISYESPLGKGLMGKKVGEKVEVEAPVGKITYTIKKIE